MEPCVFAISTEAIEEGAELDGRVCRWVVPGLQVDRVDHCVCHDGGQVGDIEIVSNNINNTSNEAKVRHRVPIEIQHASTQQKEEDGTLDSFIVSVHCADLCISGVPGSVDIMHTTAKTVINSGRADGGIETPMLGRLNEHAPEEQSNGEADGPLPRGDEARSPVRVLPLTVPVLCRKLTICLAVYQAV